MTDPAGTPAPRRRPPGDRPGAAGHRHRPGPENTSPPARYIPDGTPGRPSPSPAGDMTGGDRARRVTARDLVLLARPPRECSHPAAAAGTRQIPQAADQPAGPARNALPGDGTRP